MNAKRKGGGRLLKLNALKTPCEIKNIVEAKARWSIHCTKKAGA
jgi:hypothetical protein